MMLYPPSRCRISPVMPDDISDKQKRPALARFFVGYVAAERGHLFVQAEHFVHAGPAAGNRLQRPRA